MKKGALGFLGLSFLYVILGIVFLLFPSIGLTHICYLLGSVFVVFGVVCIVLYFMKEQYQNLNAYGFTGGAACLVFGIYILVKCSSVAGVFQQFLAVCIIINSIMKLQNSMDLLRLKDKFWWITTLLAVVTTIMAFIILCYPDSFISDTSVHPYISVVLIVDGVLSIISFFHLAVKLKQFEKSETSIIEVEDGE